MQTNTVSSSKNIETQNQDPQNTNSINNCSQTENHALISEPETTQLNNKLQQLMDKVTAQASESYDKNIHDDEDTYDKNIHNDEDTYDKNIHDDEDTYDKNIHQGQLNEMESYDKNIKND